MSLRVLDQNFNEDEKCVQTSVDHLESVIWLLIWEAIHSSPNKTMFEADWIEGLSDYNVTGVRRTKWEMIANLGQPHDLLTKVSEPLTSLAPLLNILIGIALRARTDIDKHFLNHKSSGASDSEAQLDQKCKYYFREYLKALHDFIQGSDPTPSS